MIRRILWTTSFIISLILFILFCFALYIINSQYKPASDQLPSAQAVSDYLQKNWEATQKPGLRPPIYIPTGLFIESIKFIDPNTVHITGYIWQKYTNDIPSFVTRGVVFPEGSNIKQSKAYDRIDNGTQTIGWYFEANFTHGFDYSKYPLDHKIIGIRLWPEDFDKNIILTPDLEAYDSTKPVDKFGLDPQFNMQGYFFLETYFNYVPSSYDTNFGIKNYIGQKNFPELFFNIVIMRNIINAIITNLIPLFVVLVILFGALTIMTSKEPEQKTFGFSLSGILGICSFILFVILTAHVRLRESIAGGSGIIYLEYIYFVMYFATIYVALTAFLILKGRTIKFLHHITYQDGLILKVLFLPMVLILINLVTYLFLISR